MVAYKSCSTEEAATTVGKTPVITICEEDEENGDDDDHDDDDDGDDGVEQTWR